jgi:hypothetical protein
MNSKSITSKSICYFFIAAVLYMHLCSAICAVGIGGCCGKEDVGSCHKSCCSHKEKSPAKDHHCQDLHFAFFNATGQFSQAKADISFNGFQNLAAVITPLFFVQPIPETKILFAFNGFHPPPPKDDIRIFILSFQI